jgi:hypothetical protein
VRTILDVDGVRHIVIERSEITECLQFSDMDKVEAASPYPVTCMECIAERGIEVNVVNIAGHAFNLNLQLQDMLESVEAFKGRFLFPEESE